MGRSIVLGAFARLCTLIEKKKKDYGTIDLTFGFYLKRSYAIIKDDNRGRKCA